MRGKKFNRLSKEEEKIIVHKGTEAPFSGEYYRHFEPGTYACRRCNAPLYKSDYKFDSDCGWPSFDDEIKGAVKRIPDADGMRTEIQCANCGAHLGHVFQGEKYTPKNIRHCVNSLSLKFIPAEQKGLETIVLAGGCFWCTEAVFLRVEGVKSVVSGYAGGTASNPSYEQVSGGKTGHAESVKIEFFPEKISLEKLLEIFFAAHDPTSLNKQGNDIGSQYRSAIFFTSKEQEQKVLEFIEKIHKDFDKPIVTEIKPLEKFWPAEENQKDFYKKNPLHTYCLLVIRPKLAKVEKKLKEKK